MLDLTVTIKKLLTFSALLFISLHLNAAVDLSKTDLGTPDRDYIEYPDDEEHSLEEIELGKWLFFDNRLSKNNNQSCATCHNPELGFSDGMKFGLGTDGNRVGRNAPHIYNLAWATTFFWDGRALSLEEQALGPILSSAEMGMSQELTLERLQNIKGYLKRFEEVYDDGLTFENVGKAIAAFERTFISDNAAFDQYIAGNEQAMSPSAVRGLQVFIGKGNCIDCHSGPNFTDDSFHNIGVGDADVGQFAINNDPASKSAFKTPGLRNIIYSGPYLHDGSAASLEEVIDLYNAGGVAGAQNVSKLIKPLGLDNQEKADLVAFLGALTDRVVIERPKLPE